jgi:hypothetical protein
MALRQARQRLRPLEPERDDENNYAPTGTISAFRLLVSIAARNNWDVASENMILNLCARF